MMSLSLGEEHAMTAQTSNAVVIFDGECNFCAFAVQFILRRDRAQYFQFASRQSPAGIRLLEQVGFSPGSSPNSIVLFENGAISTKSTAALRIAKRLSGFWPVFSVFLLIPAPIRDGVYDIIARNRYRFAGKRQSCMVPTPETRARFLSD